MNIFYWARQMALVVLTSRGPIQVQAKQTFKTPGPNFIEPKFIENPTINKLKKEKRKI